MDYVIKALQQNPELAIFLALAIGFAIGRVKIGSFSLGTVVGTLFAGVLIGQLDIKVPALVKTVFFDLFLFTTGYKVGPQFFRGLKRDALSQMALTLVLCTTCLADGLLRGQALRLRHRYGSRLAGRGFYRVDRDRYGGRCDQSAGDFSGREELVF